ncbi:MAG TPA: ATP-grasp domain-containing protein [Spirochaetia bacterium]|nr:ATP-grasp domain-containing protein [Spirochaetia bacterium]
MNRADSPPPPTLLLLYPYLEALHPGEITAVRPEIRLALADDCAKAIARGTLGGFDEILEIAPPESFSDAYDVLRRWCETVHPAGILMQSEVALPMGSLLARDFDLPAPSVEAVHHCTNKYLSRLTLSAAGLPTPQFKLVENADQVRRFAGQCGYPVVIKAVSSATSRLVTLVRSKEEVETGVGRIRSKLKGARDVLRLCGFASAAGLDMGCDPLRQFLVEKFVDGLPIEVDGLVIGDRCYSFGITEQVPSRDPPFYFEGYLIPAESPHVDRAAVMNTSNAAVRAAMLSDSGFSIEMRAFEGRVWIIEVNGRLGLDEGFSEMFQLRVGWDPMVQAARIALGDRTPVHIGERCCAALAYRNCYTDSVVEKLPGPAELGRARGSSAVVRIGLAAEPGGRFYAPPHPDAYPHVAWALATHTASSRAAYKAARLAVERLDFSMRPI